MTALTLPSTGAAVAVDLISAENHQLMKMEYGAAGSATQVSAANPLPTRLLNNSLVSTANSSVVNLAANAVFTGAAEDVSEFSTIVVGVFSSATSATDGLSIQQSPDGTNWDQVDLFTVPATTGKSFSAGVQAQFFRIVYTNGATTTTSFRLQTIHCRQMKKHSSVRPQDGRSNDNDVEETASFMLGYNGASWDRLRSSVANGLVVDVSRIVSTINVAGTRNNNGTGTVAGSFHLTTGGSDGTNLRPLSVDATGRLNVNAILAAETTKVIGTVNLSAAQTLATVTTVATVTSVAASTPAVSTTTAATLSSAAGTNATLVKGSAGNLYSVTASNVGAAAAFLKVFNLATAPTVGTSVPFLTIPIAPSGVANITFGSQGMRMSAGVSFSITNLVADADATAIAAAQVKVAIAYI